VKRKHYYLLVVLGVVVLSVVQYSKPAPLNWAHSFSRYDKIPYGNYLLFELLPALFGEDYIEVTEKRASRTLEDNFPALSNYIFLNDHVAFDDLDEESILSYVERGNDVFIASHGIPAGLENSLGFKISAGFGIPDSAEVMLKLPDSGSMSFDLQRQTARYFFTALDTAVSEILGWDEESRTNFISVDYGAGHFYICALPFFFTNYSMLAPNHHKYVSGALSYLKNRSTTWDEYYKSRKRYLASASPMTVIFESKALTLAYFVLMGSLLFYMAFRIKRRQRIIPVIRPIENTTLEFVETVGRLYYQESDHANLVLKRTDYFLADLRKQYHLKTNKLDADFVARLSVLSGVPGRSIEKMVNIIKWLRSKETVTAEELSTLEILLNKFYNDQKL